MVKVIGVLIAKGNIGIHRKAKPILQNGFKNEKNKTENETMKMYADGASVILNELKGKAGRI